MIPFDLDGDNRGLLVLKHRPKGFFAADKMELLMGVGQLLGMPIVHRRTQLALRERIKELTCLYEIARLVGPVDVPLDEILGSAVNLIPPAWLYPEITSARIVVDERSFLSRDHRAGCDRLRSEITIEGKQRGFVEVAYTDKKPELDEGPFLQEERRLVDAIAKELALIIDQYRAEQQRKELQEQLRHADRLATIGQLSAGVAHELNEPLSGILGFAQLAEKDPGVPEQVRRDLAKIVAASLHAREIIKKLMLFARQSEPGRKWVNLNLLVADGLDFLESRCRKSGIELLRQLDKDLPEITADPGQIYQVLINLGVNAIQAMPQGGRLTIRTSRVADGIHLEVQDTGIGMDEELQAKIFMPFFTTKDVGEGTGLGLSVVDGIVTSHGGSIATESSKGIGTIFTVYLPVKHPIRSH
jgi:signal transduction histidine kinase